MKKTEKTAVEILPSKFSHVFGLLGPRGLCVVAAICTALAAPLFARTALVMGTEEKGNKPLSEFNYTKWKGVVPIVNDKARVYQVWVNGNENLYFKGATVQLNEALTRFAKVEVKNHVVAFRPGPAHTSSFHDKTPIPYNWELHVIEGIALSRATDDIEDLEWQKDPVFTVYIGGEIELSKIEIPEGVTLRAARGQNEAAKQNEEIKIKIEEFVKQRSPETKK